MNNNYYSNAKYFLLSLGAGGVVSVKGDSFPLSLNDVMVFMAGVSTEPPLGFSHQPNIRFCEGLFPTANTCANTLHLLLSHSNDDDFMHSMCFGILNSVGYGQV